LEICDYNKCTGCSACANACPVGCITMLENALGETHPHVDENKCVGCKKCIKVCPNNREMQFRYPLKVYAAWNKNYGERKLCASGGIGTAVARYAIEKNGYFYGTRYDDSLKPCVLGINNVSDIVKYKGSKYVKSEISNILFKDIKSRLDNSVFVAFVGTPCQVAGLKSFLGKDYSNLLTVDLICHGTCPYVYFKQHIEHLKKKHKFKVVFDIRFRGNDKGNNFKLTLWDSQKLIYRGAIRYIFDLFP